MLYLADGRIYVVFFFFFFFFFASTYSEKMDYEISLRTEWGAFISGEGGIVL